MRHLWIILLCCLCVPALAAENMPQTRKETFTHFAVELPQDWDGEEQTGFISDNPAEYALTLGKKGEDNFLAQVTVYLLPNKPGVNAETAARTLTEAQGEPTAPVQEGEFWKFEGEPRAKTIKGRGVTRVNADKDYLLIILSQDTQGADAEKIVDSLQGMTPVARRLLGR